MSAGFVLSGSGRQSTLFSDFVETDWRYVERHYRTEKLTDWKSWIVSGYPLVTPISIADLRHHHVEVRFAF